MTLKQALNIILRQNRNLQRIRFTKRHWKAGLRSKWMKRWYCKNHKKVHKYTFYSIVSFTGTERMYGLDTIPEVIELAYSLLLADMNRRINNRRLQSSTESTNSLRSNLK